MKFKIPLAFTLGLVISVNLFNFILSDVESDSDRLTECMKTCNVILIVEDTLSAKHMGIYGSDNDTTPFIEEFFGEDSIIYTDMWSTASWTWASYASFMRSKYTSEVVLSEIVEPDPNSLTTILRRSGIGVFGDVPRKNNFIAESINLLVEPDKIIHNLYPPDDGYPGKFPQGSSLWLESEDRDRFFLLMHDVTVHDPYEPPIEYRHLYGSGEYLETISLWDLGNFGRDGHDPTAEEWTQVRQWEIQYDQEIRYFDDLFKSFIEAMPEEILDNTIIIVTADHGEAFGEHGRLLHSNIYSEVVHVPFLMHIPGFGTKVEITSPQSMIDLTPTVLSLMNVDYSGYNFSGQKLPFSQSEVDTSRYVKAEMGNHPVVNVSSTGASLNKEDLTVSAMLDLRAVALRQGDVSVLVSTMGEEIYLLDDDPDQQQVLKLGAPELSDLEKQIAEFLVEEGRKSVKKGEFETDWFTSD